MTLALARPAGFDELHRRQKKGEILLVVGCIGAVDLYPLSRACHPAGLKRNDVVPRKPKLRRRGDGQAQSNPITANASEHFVGDEVGVEAVDRSRADTGEPKKQSVKLCLAAGRGCVDSQGKSTSFSSIEQLKRSAVIRPRTLGTHGVRAAPANRSGTYRSRV